MLPRNKSHKPRSPLTTPKTLKKLCNRISPHKKWSRKKRENENIWTLCPNKTDILFMPWIACYNGTIVNRIESKRSMVWSVRSRWIEFQSDASIPKDGIENENAIEEIQNRERNYTQIYINIFFYNDFFLSEQTFAINYTFPFLHNYCNFLFLPNIFSS